MYMCVSVCAKDFEVTFGKVAASVSPSERMLYVRGVVALPHVLHERRG